ncbi:MAG TPA: choice-of-anchor E domain-containing protein [Edaphobacter sp.]|jgi:hypothetical protein|nr:choice-of-anchor E domain-containing protein [Edaphobacter sp.]
MRLSRPLLAVAGFVSTAATIAHADTITQTFTAPDAPFNYMVYTDTSPINQFDPSLGTLDGVTINFTTGVTGACLAILCYVDVEVTDPELMSTAWGETQLPNENPFSLILSGASSSDPQRFSSYLLGTGQVQLLVIDALGAQDGVGYASTNNLFGTIAYDYTPAPPPSPSVPEVSSIILIGTGALMGAGILRRKFSKN